ncbi:MAG: DNA-formamidopyrimidine glycosylase [Bacilli bacterium]
MPELPEVETVCRILKKWLVGKKITNIRVLYPKIIDNTTPETFCATLKGQTFQDVERLGKYLVFMLDDNVIVSHLRMEGKYYLGHYKGSSSQEGFEYDLKSSKNDHDLKHVHLIYEFSDGTILMYHDVRKFGRMELMTPATFLVQPPLSKLGIDPFAASGTYLHTQIRNKHCTIKQVLLDQSILCGIGNIYADESLFRAEISPFIEASKLSNAQCDRLVKEIQNVLRMSLLLGGSTVHSYRSTNGVSGKFQEELEVYGKEGLPCPNCGTPIVKTFLAQRGTHFCPECQAKPLPKSLHVVGVTGAIGSGKSSVSGYFAEAGYVVIDADKLAREALKKGTGCYKKVVKHFSKEILDEEGNIKRWMLRSLVVNNRSQIQFLEEVEHPYVIAETKAIIASDPNKNYLLDVPLLFESKMNELCDFVVFVNTDNKTRKERLKTRATMSLKDASDLNARVLEVSEKIAKADYIIDNSDTKENTRGQVLHLLEKIKLH